MTSPRLCRFTLVWGMLGGAALAQPGAGSAADGLRHAVLREILSAKLFSAVNRSDVRAALKVWYDDLGRQNGFLLDSKLDILDSVTEIRERLLNHSVDLLALSVDDYLELESSHLLVPILGETRNVQGGTLYSYVLLVNPSSGLTSVAGLRGKNILVASRSGANTGAVWLDVLLGNEKLGRAASFFGSVKTPDKAQACILPLFFGAVDACVVDEVSLNLAKEMNPQLGKLSVLGRSRPLIESLLAMPAEPVPFREELIDSMLSLHENPRGRQLLVVFKTGRVVPFQPADLDSARELWRDFYRLPGAPPNPANRGKEKP